MRSARILSFALRKPGAYVPEDTHVSGAGLFPYVLYESGIHLCYALCAL